MKIIGVSNLNLDEVSDIIIQENLTIEKGEELVGELQKTVRDYDTYYPKLVEDNYELYDGDIY